VTPHVILVTKQDQVDALPAMEHSISTAKPASPIVLWDFIPHPTNVWDVIPLVILVI
jgi:hypothetical protein